MIYIHQNNTVTFYDAPETIERAIHDLLMCRDDTDVGMGYDGALTRPAYEQGINDAWECARKLMLRDGLSYPDIYEIFGNGSEHDVLKVFSPSEAIAKIKEYEEKKAVKEELKVKTRIESITETATEVTFTLTDGTKRVISIEDITGGSEMKIITESDYYNTYQGDNNNDNHYTESNYQTDQ